MRVLHNHNLSLTGSTGHDIVALPHRRVADYGRQRGSRGPPTNRLTRNPRQYRGASAAYIAVSWPKPSANAGSVPVSFARRLIRAEDSSPQLL